MSSPSFVSKILKHTESAEAPTSYFIWTALTTIGAVLRDNCFINLGIMKVYPNLFTILLSSGSGVTRKSIPLSLSRRLLHKVNNTHIISGRATMAGVMKVLSSVHTDSKGKTIKGASGVLYSEEITSFFNREPDTFDILMDWYDHHDTWNNTLAGDNIRKLTNVCITLLAASNDDNIGEIYTSRIINGGLLARTVLVRESKRRKQNSLEFERNIKYDETPIVEHLMEVSRLKGVFTRTKEAKQEFHDWYMTITDDRYTQSGVEARVHTTVRKVSMLLAVSEKPELVIEKRHVEEAIDMCVRIIKGYNFLAGGQGRAVSARPAAAIIKELLNSPKKALTVPQLLRQLWGDIDKPSLDAFIETYVEANLIKVGHEPKTGETILIVTEKLLDKYKSKLEAKRRKEEEK